MPLSWVAAYVLGVPEVILNLSSGTKMLVVNALPLTWRHVKQWQMAFEG